MIFYSYLVCLFFDPSPTALWSLRLLRPAGRRRDTVRLPLFFGTKKGRAPNRLTFFSLTLSSFSLVVNYVNFLKVELCVISV